MEQIDKHHKLCRNKYDDKTNNSTILPTSIQSHSLTKNHHNCPYETDYLGVCWPPLPANTDVEIECPSWIPGFITSNKITRTCNSEGEWMNHTFQNCFNNQKFYQMQTLMILTISGYVCSILTCLAALIIFTYLRPLHSSRISMHRNLLFSFLCSSITLLIVYITSQNGNLLQQLQTISNGLLICRALHVLAQYFLTCNYFSIFSWGCYLYEHVASPMRIKISKTLYLHYFISWGIPFFLIIIYSVIRTFFSNTEPKKDFDCWFDNSLFLLLVHGPSIILLILNFLLAIRVLLTLKRKITGIRDINGSDLTHSRQLSAKALLILVPTLGFHFIFFVVKVKSFVRELFYVLGTSYLGTLVACVLCFINQNVKSVIRRRYRNWQALKGLKKDLYHGKPRRQNTYPRSKSISNQTKFCKLVRVLK
ncbi:hypothetical protein SNEBB_009896 [Seison nebaliae]|nr:hypothetical protein SNEBB_009896 [Seison nebaliae]